MAEVPKCGIKADTNNEEEGRKSLSIMTEGI
jgi:hypothetical protein